MFIYVSRVFTGSATGRVIRSVECERCAAVYHYELARAGVGKGSAPYFLFQGSAARRASRRAEKDLARKLARDAELVPCPNCGHIQQSMERFVRQRLYTTLRKLAWILPAIGLVIIPVLVEIEATSRHSAITRTWPTYAAAAGFCVLANLSGLLLRRWLVSRVNLRDPAGAAWRFIEGAPPALVPANPDAQGTEVCLQPAPTAPYTLASADGRWVTYPLSRMALPPVCCECLAPSTTTYTAPFPVNAGSAWAIPVCKECRRSLRWRWWVFALLAIAFCLCASALVAQMPRKIDEFGRWAIFLVCGLFSSLFGASMVPAILARPYRIKMVENERGVVRLRFRNPDYVRLLAGLVAANDAPRPVGTTNIPAASGT